MDTNSKTGLIDSTRKSALETHRILNSHDAATIFERVDSDTQSLRASHREQSVAQRTRDGAESVLGDEEFPGLDDHLVNSGVYRRVLNANLRRSDNGSSDAMHTIRTAEAEVAGIDQTRLQSDRRPTVRGTMLGNLLRSRYPQHTAAIRRPRSAMDVPLVRGQRQVRSTLLSSAVTLPMPTTMSDAQSESGGDQWDKIEALISGNATSVVPRVVPDNMSERAFKPTLLRSGLLTTPSD